MRHVGCGARGLLRVLLGSPLSFVAGPSSLMEPAPLQRTSSGSVEPDWIATVVLEAKSWHWSAGTSDIADCQTTLGPDVGCRSLGIG